MGLNSSRSRRKVTKVTPMTGKGGEPRQPCSMAVYSFQSPPSTWVSPLGRSPALERQLPPLRKTLHGRYPTGPKFDQTVRVEETSIIKQHPPRRLQKFEPFILAENIPVDKYLHRQEGPVMLKAKELETGGVTATHPIGRRQYLLKMKMLEMKKEAELKRCLKMEARPEKPKRKSLHLLGALEQTHGSQSSGDDLHSIKHDQTFNESPGDLWNRESLKKPGSPGSHLGQKDKVETWLMKQQATTGSSSDASSTDSNHWNDYIDNFRKPYRRPALVRTKTERITLFDEFFDKDF